MGRNVISWVLERRGVFLWSSGCFCEASRDWPGSISHNTTNFGWVPATHLFSQLVLHICVLNLNTRSSIPGSRGQKSEAPAHVILPFSWGRACCLGCKGALPCEKQPPLATAPGSAPQIFHSVPHAVVHNCCLWEAARPAFSSLLSSHGGTLKATITFFFVTL